MTMSPTRIVVGGIIAAGMLAAGYAVLGFHGGLIVTAALLYEGWTLVNRYPNDTISEAIWEFAARPMVPFVFGVASGWALTVSVLPNQFAVAAWFFLMGHFFFQKHEASR
jgi:hypothetical protein